MADQAVDLARLLRLDVDPADLHEQPEWCGPGPNAPSTPSSPEPRVASWWN